jgi:hypothetical protein
MSVCHNKLLRGIVSRKHRECVPLLASRSRSRLVCCIESIGAARRGRTRSLIDRVYKHRIQLAVYGADHISTDMCQLSVYVHIYIYSCELAIIYAIGSMQIDWTTPTD